MRNLCASASLVLLLLFMIQAFGQSGSGSAPANDPVSNPGVLEIQLSNGSHFTEGAACDLFQR